jgi:hypothetical protein
VQRGLLDVAGFLEGTLKSSRWVDILRHYERHFAEYRHADIEILEIGVDNGSSLAIWKQYFTKARFIGVDISPKCRQFADERVSIEIGSQDDPEFLLGLTRRYNPTIIIDDGSHLAHHIPFTFERLFPSLPPGGMYVIEDMFFHLEPAPNKWMGYSTTTSPDYLFGIVRLLFTERLDRAVDYGINAHLRNSVEEIAFAPLGVAFIRKKSAPIPLADRIALGEDYARREGRAAVWEALAIYIQRNAGPLERAAEAARMAVAAAPESVQYHRTLAGTLWLQGDFDGALLSGTAATELDPDDGVAWDLRGRVHFSRQEYAEAEAALRRALHLRKDDPAIERRLGEAIAARERKSGMK